ncbi:FtsX-like permease family protein [Antribacter gilvus]|uniref:FtsX-like permease family protein n=1 Tax=Antribacter gilvus TaxID=2304675 RepID=UPI000F7AB38E|nr:FtsX-like permease family protein [Antribacter gilvus]
MAWLPRVLGRRAGAQLGVLAAVTALTLVTCSLLGSFSLLLTTAQDRALGAALDSARPADVALVADLRLGGPMNSDGAARTAVETTSGALASLAGDVPLTTSAWVSTGLMQPGEDLTEPATYLASVPDSSLVRVVEGTVPAPGAPLLEPDVVPVAVPESAAEALGWSVGDRLDLRGTNSASRVTVEVTGVYELVGPRSAWRPDLLEGASHDPAFPLPESFGFATVRVWGPLLAPEATLLDGVVPAAEARVTSMPDLTGLTTAGSAAMRDRLVDGQSVLRAATDRQTRSSVLSTRLDDTLEGVAARLAATHAGVLVAGLALLVVGGAALLLAARLLSEQRTAGLALMAARGTSHGQLLALAALEAAAVAAVAALAAPWLAALLVSAVSDALVPGGSGGAALPFATALATPALWWTCAAGAALLAALLMVPVLRPDDADSDAPTTRPGRAAAVRTALARSGGTVALLVVAGVAGWQLDRYRTPSADAGADPVLVAAPALLLLACALLVVRALPLLARATDALAARSRRLVAPLAAWETGRRPDRAAGTVLLVTLAVASGTFAQVTLATWRTSQVEQAAQTVGTDLRLTDVPGSPLDASAQVAALALLPVTDRAVAFQGADGDSEGLGARLLGVDDASVLRGRVEPSAGLGTATTWDDVVAHLGPAAAPAAGLPLPAEATRLSARITATVDPPLAGSVFVNVVLEDERGVRTQSALVTNPLGGVPLGGSTVGEVTLRDAAPADGSAGASLRVVGLLVTAVPGRDLPDEDLVGGPGTLQVTVADLTATDSTGAVTPVPLDGSWTALTRPQSGGTVGTGIPGAGTQSPVDAEASASALTLEQRIEPVTFSFEGDGFVAAPGALAVPQPLPAVVTAELAASAELVPGDTVRLGGSAPFLLEVAGVVEHLPGGTGPGILVRRDTLQAAELAAAAAARGPDAWWGTVPDDAVPALTAAAVDLGEAQSLAGERAALLDGPDRVGLQAALWILSAAAVLLAGAGVATSVAAGLRLRRLELARLQALGVPRAALVRAVLAEHGLLAAVGLTGGLGVGALVAALLATALAVGPDGRVPVPDPVLDVPWASLAWLGGAALVVVALAVGGTARTQVRQASADLLRLGADR